MINELQTKLNNLLETGMVFAYDTHFDSHNNSIVLTKLDSIDLNVKHSIKITLNGVLINTSNQNQVYQFEINNALFELIDDCRKWLVEYTDYMRDNVE